MAANFIRAPCESPIGFGRQIKQVPLAYRIPAASRGRPVRMGWASFGGPSQSRPDVHFRPEAKGFGLTNDLARSLVALFGAEGAAAYLGGQRGDK